MDELNLRHCLIYLDDIIIFSSTFDEHIERLQAVFERLQEHKLKLKASKCEFFKSRVGTLATLSLKKAFTQIQQKQKLLKSGQFPRLQKRFENFLALLATIAASSKDSPP